MLEEERVNEALQAEGEYKTAVEEAYDYVENFDILETITNVGNDEVFTPRKTADMMLNSLPDEVWHNPDYRWLNPATKNGIFEREIAIRLDEGLKDVIPDTEKRRKHILQNMIFSIGQTKFTANVARRTLYYCSQANRQCDGLKAPDGHYVNGYAIGNGSWFSDEEGNILTPNTDHDIDPKTKKCKYCGIAHDSKYLDANQREKYAYEFIHINHLVLEKHLQKRFFKGDKQMKFDIIIGNPPYQLSTAKDSSQATPIYHLFVEQAISLRPKYICMIIPSRWYSGGMGLDNFRNNMMKDKHIEIINDFPNASDCFPANNISGGVCFFLWNRDSSVKQTKFITHKNGIVDSSSRPLDEFPVLVRYNKAVDIIRKVIALKEPTLESLVSSISPYGIPTNYDFKEKGGPGYLTTYTSKGIKYVEKKAVTKVSGYENKYKVLVSQTIPGKAGEPGPDGLHPVIASTTKVIEKDEICTHSYILIGKFDEKEQADNLLTYLKTLFARFLIYMTVSSIHLSKSSFIFVPAQDFSKTLTDKELFEKYHINEDEISFIKSIIKEMV